MFACSSPASSARRVLFVLFGIEISGREVLSTNEKQLDSHSSQQVRGALRICRVLLLARVDGELDRDVSEARVKPDGPENEEGSVGGARLYLWDWFPQAKPRKPVVRCSSGRSNEVV